MALIIRRPRPGSEKIVSVSTAPDSSRPSCRPMTVTTGMSALRSTCLSTTRHSGRPLARAVRTWSCERIDNISERVIRVMMATGMVPSVQAGSTRWRRLTATRFRSPEMTLSTTDMPVMRGGSTPIGMSPPIGSQSRKAPKTRIIISPYQKIGIDTPNSVTVMTMLSKRGDDAERHAEDDGKSESGERQLNRHGEGGPDIVEGGTVAAQRQPEIALDRADREAQILDIDRLVEAKLAAQVFELHIGSPVPQEHRRHVARQDMHGQEHDQADADEHQDQLNEPSNDVLGHAGCLVLAALSSPIFARAAIGHKPGNLILAARPRPPRRCRRPGVAAPGYGHY